MNYSDFVGQTLADIKQVQSGVHPMRFIDLVLTHPELQHVGTWLEFGVASGDTLARLAAARGDAEVWGFDVFTGLPEDWRPTEGLGKGAFAQRFIPIPVNGSHIITGLFEDTLPCFKPRSPVTLVHIDCDIYSAALTALNFVKPYLALGAIIVFDELYGYTGFEEHEMKSLYESGITGKWISATRCEKAALQVMP